MYEKEWETPGGGKELMVHGEDKKKGKVGYFETKSIPILCNNLYRIMGCSFSFIKVSMVWPNHVKPCILYVLLFYFMFFH